MRQIVFLLLLAGLCACSGAPPWTKSGASPETARADLRECQAEARSLVRQDQNIDSDIMATRGQDWQRTGSLGVKRETLSSQNQGRGANIVELCMRGKGYAPAAPP